MKHVLLLFRKDFKRRWKNPVVIVGFLLIPIVFAFIFGSVFGGSEDEILPKISVLAADNDQSILSNLFLGALTQGELKDMLQVQAVTEEEGRRLLDRGKASALLIIPLEFGESLWRGTATELMLIKNPAEQFLPQIVEEIADTGTLILSALFTVFADEIELIRGLIEEESVPDKAVAAISVRMRNRIDGIAKFVFPPVISLKQITPSQPGRKQTQELGVVDQILPAMAILFLLFICNVVFEDVLKEKESGTLLRMSVSPLKLIEFIWSKLLTAMAIGAACTVIQVILGWIIFGIHWGNPVGLLLIIISLNILISGFISIFYSFIKSEQQAGAVLSSVILVMSLLGGSMVPVEQFPRFIQGLSRFTVNYWGITAFRQNMLGTAGPVLWSILAGMGFAGLAFSFIGAAFLQKNLRKGLIR